MDAPAAVSYLAARLKLAEWDVRRVMSDLVRRVSLSSGKDVISR